VPATVSAQLTFNGVQGSTFYYSTSSLNPGDTMQIALQWDATGLSTGRYSYSVAVTANYGTPVTTTTSGSVDIINSSTSPFGAGWSLSQLERLWPVTGGVILEQPGGTSLGEIPVVRHELQERGHRMLSESDEWDPNPRERRGAKGTLASFVAAPGRGYQSRPRAPRDGMQSSVVTAERSIGEAVI
jgi:hypothetical protein